MRCFVLFFSSPPVLIDVRQIVLVSAQLRKNSLDECLSCRYYLSICKETSYRKSHMQRHMLAVSTLLGCKTVNLFFFFFFFFTVLYGLTLSGQFDNKLFTYHLLLYVNAWSQPVRCLREADWPSVSSPTCSLLRLPLILKKITVCADAGRFPPFSRTSFSYFVYLL